MRLLRLVRHHPGIFLAVVATAFAAWVWVDVFRGLSRPADPQVADGPNDGSAAPFFPKRVPPPPPIMGLNGELAPVPEPEQPRSSPTITAQVLPKLKPGMTRTEVEGLVGAPQARDVYPATFADGRVTYRASYEADLEPPPTVRPIRPGRHVAKPPANRTMVTLEFDATKPGHPLIEVHYPDPLF
jgi:hypothetical protein